MGLILTIYLHSKGEELGCIGENTEKEGYNPISQQTIVVKRRRIEIDRELPMKEAYTELISQILATNWASAD